MDYLLAHTAAHEATALYDTATAVEPRPIAEFIERLDIPHAEVRREPACERTALRRETQRLCGMQRHASQRFIRREAEESCAHARRQQQRGAGRRARIAIASNGHARFRFAQFR